MFDTRIIGIVNVTPDSFSDGGACYSPGAAIAAMERIIAEGADIIDIGAESTRPGATPLTHEDEWQRLSPVLEAMPRFAAAPVQFSVDTRHAATACKALEHGADWINDVSGFTDPAMVEAMRLSTCKLVVMHSLTVPADKDIIMPDVDVVQALLAFAQARIRALEAAGIARERIIFDPGIGFGKSAAQSWNILHSIRRFHALGVPVLVGHSRKSFLAEFGDRDDATLVISHTLAGQGVDYLRVHDVARHRRMLNVVRALHHG